MTTYRLTVLQLIVELRKWARARDRVNQKPSREGRPLSSDPLLEAANRLEDYHDSFVTCHHCMALIPVDPETVTIQDDPERLLNYQERRQPDTLTPTEAEKLRERFREEYANDPHKLAEIHRDEKEASS